MNHRRQQKLHYQRRVHGGHRHPSGAYPNAHAHHLPGGHGVSHSHVHHKHKHKKHGQKYGLHGHGQLTSKVQVHPVQMMEALSAYNNSAAMPSAAIDFVIKENVIAAHNNANNVAVVQQQQQRESEHNRQL